MRERDAKIAQLIRIAMQSAAAASGHRATYRCQPVARTGVLRLALSGPGDGRMRVDADANNNRSAKPGAKPHAIGESANDTLDTLPCTNRELSIVTVTDTDADDADCELTLTSISIDTTMQREHAREERANSTFVPEWDANVHKTVERYWLMHARSAAACVTRLLVTFT